MKSQIQDNVQSISTSEIDDALRLYDKYISELNEFEKKNKEDLVRFKLKKYESIFETEMNEIKKSDKSLKKIKTILSESQRIISSKMELPNLFLVDEKPINFEEAQFLEYFKEMVRENGLASSVQKYEDEYKGACTDLT